MLRAISATPSSVLVKEQCHTHYNEEYNQELDARILLPTNQDVEKENRDGFG